MEIILNLFSTFPNKELPADLLQVNEIRMYMYICEVYVHVHPYMYVCIYTRIYIYTHICINTHSYIF